MIRLVEPCQTSALSAATLKQMGAFVIKQCAQLEMYGEMLGAFDLWLQTQPNGVVSATISRFSGVLTICALPNLPDEQMDELREFARQLGGSKLEGEETLLRRLGIAGGGLLPFSSSWIMRIKAAERQCVPTDKRSVALKIEQTHTLAPVYHLLCRTDAHFSAQACYAAWLTDFSHRCRYGQSECYILKDDNDILSTASILYINEKQALIGGVATDLPHRHKGYARRLLTHIHEIARQRGLTLWLFAVDDAAAEFYQACGWERQGRWTSRELAPL